MNFGRDYRNSGVDDVVGNCDDEALRKLELEDYDFARKQFGGIQDEVGRSCDGAQCDNRENDGISFEEEVQRRCKNVCHI